MQARTALSFARILNLPQPSSGGLLVAFDGLQACWRTLTSLAAATRPPLQVSGVWLGAERPQWIPSALQHARQFSREAIRSQERALEAAAEDTVRPRVLRIFAFIMICGAGLNVAPMVASQAVANCLVLLEAQQPFMVKAGCSRLQLLMRLDAAHKRAVAEGAAAKLVRLMERPDTDQGVVDYVLAALEDLARTEEGIQSLADAGGQAALQSYLAGVQRCPDTEESTLRSRRLLAALEQV